MQDFSEQKGPGWIHWFLSVMKYYAIRPLSEVDSVLKEWNKNDIDSVGFVSITNDSSYVFPLTNYQSSLLETRTAGDNQQVSEVVKLGDVKLLYRLKVDENVLRRRNISARPTEYMKQVIDAERK